MEEKRKKTPTKQGQKWEFLNLKNLGRQKTFHEWNIEASLQREGFCHVILNFWLVDQNAQKKPARTSHSEHKIVKKKNLTKNKKKKKNASKKQ